MTFIHTGREDSIAIRGPAPSHSPNVPTDQLAMRPTAIEQTLVLLMQQLKTSDETRTRETRNDRNQAKLDRHEARMATLATRDCALLDTEFAIDQMDVLLQTEIEAHQAAGRCFSHAFSPEIGH